MKDTYYDRGEVSNSDLGWLDKYLNPDRFQADPHEAYKFGNLIDAMITEVSKVDYFKQTVSDYEDEPFENEAWVKALEMKKSFYKDPFCKQIHAISDCQKVFIDNVFLRWGGVRFSLRMRCKFDLYMEPLKWGADVKSTTCTTQAQFEEACRFFNYDRQRAVYMTLAKSDKDCLIGISKENFKVFKVPINRGDDFFKSGMEKFEDLAFKWWCLFENNNL
jgi:hypothetical protein